MNQDEKIVKLIHALQDKIRDLDETILRLIQANTLIYEISKEISISNTNNKVKDRIKLMIDNYATK